MKKKKEKKRPVEKKSRDMQSVGQKNKNPSQNAAMQQLQKVINTKQSQLQKLNLESGLSYNSFTENGSSGYLAPTTYIYIYTKDLKNGT